MLLRRSDHGLVARPDVARLVAWATSVARVRSVGGGDKREGDERDDHEEKRFVHRIDYVVGWGCHFPSQSDSHEACSSGCFCERRGAGAGSVAPREKTRCWAATKRLTPSRFIPNIGR